MNCLQTLGKEIRAIALIMLDDAEDALKEMGIYSYAYDRAASKIYIFSGTPRNRHLLFIIQAIPYAKQLAVFYMAGRIKSVKHPGEVHTFFDTADSTQESLRTNRSKNNSRNSKPKWAKQEIDTSFSASGKTNAGSTNTDPTQDKTDTGSIRTNVSNSAVIAEYAPVYRFRWRKPCRRDLSLALRKLQSSAPLDNKS